MRKVSRNLAKAAVFSGMLLACGPGEKNDPGGQAGAATGGAVTGGRSTGGSNEGGAVTGGVTNGGSSTGGVTSSGGNDTGGVQSLCDGDEMHVKDYEIGVGERVECDSQVVIFTSKTSSGRVTFTITDGDNPMVSDHMSLEVGAQSVQDIRDIGDTTFELCSISGDACSYTISGIEGDASCRAVLASDRALGQVGECN